MPTFQSLFASINRMVQQTDGDPLSKSQGKQDDVAIIMIFSFVLS